MRVVIQSPYHRFATAKHELLGVLRLHGGLLEITATPRMGIRITYVVQIATNTRGQEQIRLEIEQLRWTNVLEARSTFWARQFVKAINEATALTQFEKDELRQAIEQSV